MTTGEPFDVTRDPELADALRRVLSQPDDQAFAERVMARLPERPTLWDQLARWARPGIAAAFVGAALMGYWLILREAESDPTEPAAELAATDRPLDEEELMGVILGSIR
jgi:hypothetical protein